MSTKHLSIFAIVRFWEFIFHQLYIWDYIITLSYLKVWVSMGRNRNFIVFLTVILNFMFLNILFKMIGSIHWTSVSWYNIIDILMLTYMLTYMPTNPVTHMAPNPSPEPASIYLFLHILNGWHSWTSHNYAGIKNDISAFKFLLVALLQWQS